MSHLHLHRTIRATLRRASILVFLALVWSPVRADQTGFFKVTITGAFTNVASAKIAIFLDGSTWADECDIRGPMLVAATLCTSTKFSNTAPKSARIEISSEGHKRFSKNVPLLAFTGEADPTAMVDLGTITLLPTELPSVEQVVMSRGKDRSYRFEITLKNPLKKVLLVSEVTVIGVRAKDHGGECCCPPSAEFHLGDTLYVTTAKKGLLKTRGTFEETKRSAGYTTEASGTLDQDGCNHGEWLQLNLAASIQLPAEDEIAVLVHLPERFKITKSQWRFGHGPSGQPDPSLVGHADTGRSEYFNFRFITTDENELPIVATYRSRPP